MKYDLIILPSAAFEPIIPQLVDLKFETKTRLLMIIDNWDNLSSKTILWKKPDFLATWGPQSTLHAIEIQNFPESRIFEIGAARFSNHIYAREINKLTQPLARYALFVGTFLKFDELKCLEILNEEININRDVYGDFKIVYRPHPFKEEFKFDIKNLNNIELDDKLISFTQQGSTRNLDYAESMKLQLGAKFIVGGLTSMLVESSILGKKYLALVHREKGNVTSPDEVYRSYEHFSEISILPNIAFVDSIEDLSMKFKEMFLSADINQNLIDDKLSYFYDLRDITFSQKLKILVDQIHK
jgi:hypothetical protein